MAGWKDRATPVANEDSVDTVKPSWKERASLVEPEISEMESGARGALQGASMGFADEISGGVEALWNKAQGDPAEFGELYKKYRDESRENFKSAEEANPGSYMAGEIGGGVATAFVPGLNVAKGATLAARAGQAAAMGAATGLGMSEEDNIAGLAKDAALGGALGGAFQGLGEKVIAPGAKKIGQAISDNVISSDGALNKFLAKSANFATGVDEDSARWLLARPDKVARANPGNWASDSYAFDVGQKAVNEASELGVKLGQDVNQASENFLKFYGDSNFDKAKILPDIIDDFLHKNAPSAKGFSALDSGQISELENISSILKGGDVTGEDLFKFRQYLDNVEKLAGKYDQEGTSPFVNFLKKLRHEADQIVDGFDVNLNRANKAYSQYKTDMGTLRSAGNDARAESMINNLYGTNKTAQQEAAARLFSTDTMMQAKDIAAAKAFQNAKGPSGSDFGAKRLLTTSLGVGAAIPTGGLSLLAIPAVSPKAWMTGLGLTGRLQQKLRTNPQALGKFQNVLQNAFERGNQAVAATHFVLSQQDPEYRQLMKDIEGENEEE